MPESVAASAVAEIGSEDLHSLSADERASWEATGTWPERQAETPAAAPAAVEPAAEADEDDADEAPAPVAAAPVVEAKPVSKRQQQINDLIRSRAEADAKAAALEAKIAALEGKSKTATPETAQEAIAATVEPTSAKPKIEDFESIDAYMEALTDWKIEQRESVTRANAAKTAAQRELETRAGSWIQRRDAFFATQDAAAVATAGKFLEGVSSGTPLGDVLIESPVGPQVALHLATHPDDADRIARLAPLAQIRELGKLEGKFDTQPTARAQEAAVKTVTTAPAPPTTVTAATGSTVDDVTDAIDRGDFRAYEAAANRRDLSRK